MFKKLTNFIVENKDTIRTRALIVGGTLAGIVIAGALLSKISVDSDVIVIDEVDPNTPDI